MMKQWNAREVTTTARETLDAIAEKLAEAPEAVRHELTKLRGEMDQYRTALRDGGWTEGQIGAMVFDALQQAGHDHAICVLVSMECLK